MSHSYNCNFEYFMGPYASAPTSSKKKNYKYESEPIDTEALKDKHLPKLFFHSILANVKIKNYPYVRKIVDRKKQYLYLKSEKGRFSLLE